MTNTDALWVRFFTKTTDDKLGPIANTPVLRKLNTYGVIAFLKASSLDHIPL